MTVEEIEFLLGRILQENELTTLKITQSFLRLSEAAFATRDELLKAGRLAEAEQAQNIALKASDNMVMWAKRLRVLLLADAH